MKNNIINIRDIIKKKLNTHTVDCASIYPTDKEHIIDELTDEQLCNVVGGMNSYMFSQWRATTLNNFLTGKKNDY